jgi:microcystin-dependent protein
MSNAFVGQITMFGGNFAPRGFALCNGQLMPIAQNQALFSLIGTTYGGDGRTTFGLPNLQSYLALHYGQGPGQPSYILGQTTGSPTATLTTATTPQHTHSLNASLGPGNTVSVGSGVVPATAVGDTGVEFYATPIAGQPALTPVSMDQGVCGPAGGNASHSNLMPSLCITFIIALQGLFPSRN